MLTATGIKLKVIKSKSFNRNWKVELLKDKAGYTIAICHFDCGVKTFFRFDKEAAELVFNQACNEISKGK